MNIHFGKQKYRSGNIPFTMFGPFDMKNDILFKDATDDFKTKLEVLQHMRFDNNLEKFYANYLNDDLQHCKSSSSIVKSNFLLFSMLMFFIAKQLMF